MKKSEMRIKVISEQSVVKPSAEAGKYNICSKKGKL